MRAAAILGLGSSTRDFKPFQETPAVEWILGLPAQRDGLDAILVFGGDGTVHRHLAALTKLQLPVLVVPAGSGNDFARALGLLRVRDSLEAWRKFAAGSGKVRIVDLGWITPIGREPESVTDGRGRPSLHAQDARGKAVYFSCAAGVGLDGEISRRANALPRWLRGHGGYAFSLPPALLRFQPFSLQLGVATEVATSEFLPQSEQAAVAVIFANTPVYGGGMKVAPKAKLDDGQLDVCLIRDMGKLKLLSVFPSIYFGRHLGVREVAYFPAAGACVETDRPLDVYADGEYVCQTPVEMGVARSALPVIVPG